MCYCDPEYPIWRYPYPVSEKFPNKHTVWIVL